MKRISQENTIDSEIHRGDFLQQMESVMEHFDEFETGLKLMMKRAKELDYEDLYFTLRDILYKVEKVSPWRPGGKLSVDFDELEKQINYIGEE